MTPQSLSERWPGGMTGNRPTNNPLNNAAHRFRMTPEYRAAQLAEREAENALIRGVLDYYRASEQDGTPNLLPLGILGLCDRTVAAQTATAALRDR